jgi:hypothetical protein
LHGRRVWTTSRGRELQSAEYERGRLVKWNGRPVAEALQEWCAANAVSEGEQKLLMKSIEDPQDIKPTRSDPGEIVFHFPRDKQQLLLCFASSFHPGLMDFEGRSCGELLLEQALEEMHTFAYRYHTLTIVPISRQSLDWDDWTGVYEVKFAAGSEQEQFWLQEVAGIPYLLHFPAARFRRMFAAEGQAPISVDTTALGYQGEPEKSPQNYVDNWIGRTTPRVRRDLFGQHLERENCYVVQQGSKLIIKCHADDRDKK